MASLKKEGRRGGPYSEEEKQRIMETPTSGLKELSVELKRSYDSVRRKKWQMENKEQDSEYKIRYNRKRNSYTIEEARYKNTRWTKNEEKLLLQSEKTDIDIAREIGRTLASVTVKRCRLLAERKKNNGRKTNR